MSAQVYAFAPPTAELETGFSEASIGIAPAPSLSQEPFRTATRDRAAPKVSSQLEFRHLRDRLSGAAAQELSAEETLFILLSFICRERAGILTGQLLNQFGSFGAVLKASPQRLAKILPDHERLYILLRSVHRAVTLALREPIDNRPVFQNMSQLRDYLRVSLAHEEREVVRLLFLD